MSFFLFLLETNYSSSVRLLLVDFFFFERNKKPFKSEVGI